MTLTTLQIDKMNATALAALRGLTVTSDQVEFGGDFPSGVDAALAQAPNVVGFTLLKNEAPVGLFLLKRPPASPYWAPVGSVTLHALKIDLRWQGRGLGHLAMRAVIEAAAALSPPAKKLMLSVDAGNTAAASLYERAGMTRVGPPTRGRVGWEHRFAFALR